MAFVTTEERVDRLEAVLGQFMTEMAVINQLTTLGIYALRMGEDTMELANAAALEGR